MCSEGGNSKDSGCTDNDLKCYVTYEAEEWSTVSKNNVAAEVIIDKFASTNSQFLIYSPKVSVCLCRFMSMIALQSRSHIT